MSLHEQEEERKKKEESRNQKSPKPFGDLKMENIPKSIFSTEHTYFQHTTNECFVNLNYAKKQNDKKFIT